MIENVRSIKAKMHGAIIIAFSLIVALNQCDFTSKFEKNLTNYISQQEDEESFILDINEITYFKWTELYIFKPYSTQNEIEEILGKTNRKIKISNIEYSESICLLVFKYKTRIAKVIKVNRRFLDFAKVRKDILPKMEAVFKVYDGYDNRLYKVSNYKKKIQK